MYNYQWGGGTCSLCNSPGTNKSTCPCNPDVIKPNFDKHPRWAEFCPGKGANPKKASPTESKASSSKPKASPPKSKASPKKKVSPTKPKVSPPKPQHNIFFWDAMITGFINDHPGVVNYMIDNMTKNTAEANFLEYFSRNVKQNIKNLYSSDFHLIENIIKDKIAKKLYSTNWIKANEPEFVESMVTLLDLTSNSLSSLENSYMQLVDDIKQGQFSYRTNAYEKVFNIHPKDDIYIFLLSRYAKIAHDIVKNKYTGYGTRFEGMKPEPYDPNSLNRQEQILLENYVVELYNSERTQIAQMEKANGGVPNATKINTAVYKKLSLKFHPDRCISRPFDIPGFPHDKFLRIPDKVCTVLMQKLASLK